ncbi:MAG TPA: hypothetical protein VM843_08930 [Flavisolibacter sp.]|nr:hypothetical protein [Flavisolibacter sp.]
MLVFHLFLLLLSTMSGNRPVEDVQVIPYKLGATQVELHKIIFEGPTPLSIVHLHANEVTARTAAETILAASGGVLLTLENGEKRLLSFRHRGSNYLADPNRIFTLLGRRATLKVLSRYNKAAAVELLRFANFYVLQIEPAETVIGVHNNTDANYSVLNYRRGGSFFEDAKETHINDARDPDDFYITTDDSLFQKLKRKDYNVVLQNNARADDDGSLSIYYARKGKSYINVEAEHGHVAEQVLMLQELHDLLQ